MHQNTILKMMVVNNDFKDSDYIHRTLTYIFDNHHAEFFNILYEYYSQHGTVPDIEYLNAFFDFEKESLAKSVYQEIISTPLPEKGNVSAYVELQVNYNLRNSAARSYARAEEMIKTCPTKLLREKIQEANYEVANILRDISKDKNVSITLHGAEAKENLRRDYEERPTFLCKYGIKSMDQSGGIYIDDFIQVAGYAGQGKSTLLRQLAYNALMQGLNVFFTTMEMTAKVYQNHFTVLHANNTEIHGFNHPKITYHSIKNKTLSEEEGSFFFDVAAEDLLNNENYGTLKINQPSAGYTILDLHNDILHTNRTEFPVDLIVTDYLVPHIQPVIIGRRSVDKEDYNGMLAFHRQFCLDNFFASANAAQINRAGFDAACKHKENLYNPSVMSDYNGLERYSTVVWSVFQSSEMEKSKEIQVQQLKGRESGICKPFKLIRDGENGRHFESRIPTKDESVSILESIEI